MTLKALIIRADCAFAEIGELRRRAFLAAFREADYDWPLDRNWFAASARLGNLKNRMLFFVLHNLKSTTATPDIKNLALALHRKAYKVFSYLIADGALEPREGMRDVIVSAAPEGVDLHLVVAMRPNDVEMMLKQTLGERAVGYFRTITALPEEEVGSDATPLYENLNKQITTPRQNCLVIESSIHAMEVAKSLGYHAICTRSATCMDGISAIDSAGVFEDLPAILARGGKPRSEPLTMDERAELFIAFKHLMSGNFSKDQTSKRGEIMHVSDILKIKGSAVKSVSPTMTVRNFAKSMSAAGVGAMMVQDQTGKLCGIITERDLARGLTRYGPDLANLPVSTLMTSELITCAPDDSLASVAKIMTENRIRHLPVVVNGDLKGLISIGDVLKSRLDEVQLEANMLRDFALARR